MKVETSVIRRKIMGVALRQARLAQGRSLEDCAGVIQASAEEVAQIERGARDLTLPELEVLAAYLQVPVSAVISGQLPTGDAAKVLSPQVRALRRKIIGALLRKAREAAGKDAAEVAAALGVAPETVQQYERGQLDIPAAQLVVASDILQTPLESFLQSPPSTSLSPSADADLPEEMRTFIASPQSRPYLQLAMALSHLSPQALRALGEALLGLPAAD